MPKFGDAGRLFNNSAYKYGVDGANPGGELQWIFLIDWDGNESYSYNEASYLIDLETTRGERYFVRPNGNGFETMRPGEGTATLIDRAGRFDPDNVSSPLYEKILPGRKFRLSVKDLSSGTVYPVMAGYINDIPPLSEVDKIQLSLRETMSLLDRKVSIPILYRNGISDAMSELISAAKYPVLFGSSLDSETQQITSFQVDNINALDVLIDLGAACLGQVFADNTGKLKFYNRGHSTMASHNLDQAQVLKMIRRSQPWENLRNIIQVVVNKKVKAPEAALWQSGQPIEIDASSTKTFWLRHVPAIDIRVYSYDANTAINFEGADITASISISLDVYSDSMEVAITNNYAGDAYVKLVITGRPIVDQEMLARVENALSQSDYGEMTFELDNPYMQDYNHASAFATMISNFLDEPQRTIEVQIEQRPSVQFAFDLMDKIVFTSAKLAISGTYYAGLIEHRWQAETGQSVVTTLVMRPRLTDATSINNDPEDPDLPYIPEPPLPPGGGTIPIPPPPNPDPPPDPDPDGTCLSDPDAPVTGPYKLLTGNSDVILKTNGVREHLFDTPFMFARPSTHVNQTIVAITGDWLVYSPTTQTWNGTEDLDFWHVFLNDNELIKQDEYNDGGHGTRFLTWFGGAEQMLNIRTTITDSTVGNILYQGTVDATDSTGFLATLTPGALYTIEGYGGPWDWNGNPYNYTIRVVSLGLEITVGSSNGTWADFGGTFQFEHINTYYSRGYFYAVTANNYIRVPDVYYPDNTGTMGYILRGPYANPIYMWKIRQVTIYNYCA